MACSQSKRHVKMCPPLFWGFITWRIWKNIFYSICTYNFTILFFFSISLSLGTWSKLLLSLKSITLIGQKMCNLFDRIQYILDCIILIIQFYCLLVISFIWTQVSKSLMHMKGSSEEQKWGQVHFGLKMSYVCYWVIVALQKAWTLSILGMHRS